jgi:hypothetical protein
MSKILINKLNIVSLRGAKRRSNLGFNGEIAALPAVARNDNVTLFYAFVLVSGYWNLFTI